MHWLLIIVMVGYYGEIPQKSLFDCNTAKFRMRTVFPKATLECKPNFHRVWPRKEGNPLRAW